MYKRQALSIWEWFKDISMVEYKRIYKMLNMDFDHYTGESFYRDKTAAVVEELKEKNLLKESEGAMIVDLDEYDMAPCLVMKKDGSSIYATRDLAAIFYRKKEYNFDKCIYVTGLEPVSYTHLGRGTSNRYRYCRYNKRYVGRINSDQRNSAEHH